jgi:hypothetical protein
MAAHAAIRRRLILRQPCAMRTALDMPTLNPAAAERMNGARGDDAAAVHADGCD